MNKGNLADNLINIFMQYNLTENNFIKFNQIIKDKINKNKDYDKTKYFYFKCNFDENNKSEHTVILVGDENNDLYEKLKYFKEQDKKIAGFASFSELYKYTDFVITLQGQ
ncbi:16451_t:CDS:1 [Cetraspora pellucida]|uniref:16451_t:CDS:1 n=1 Tax=Cetraspora pellucida TaxID=1433469 RepID=A0ACA9KZA9_9GLOM|nr:16451_t:CDS:1 [Cetraspora pellucida]